MKTKNSSELNLAEITTLVCSIVIIGAVIIYLVRDIINPPPEHPSFEIKVLTEEISKTENGYSLPVEIKNVKGKGVSELWVEIESESFPLQQIKVEYLGRGSAQKLNIVLDKNPSVPSFRTRVIYFAQ